MEEGGREGGGREGGGREGGGRECGLNTCIYTFVNSACYAYALHILKFFLDCGKVQD